MGNYTGNPSNGVILTSALPADNTKLMAADVNVPLEVLLDNDAAIEAAVNLKAPIASPTFTGIVSLPGAPLLPGLANHGAVVSSGGFTVVKTGTINHAVPTGGAGYTEPVIWTTPSQSFIIEGAIIEITGTSTANADPSYVYLTLYIGPAVETLAIAQISPFGTGTAYTINGTTANQAVFGLLAAERGSVLTSPLSNGGKDSRGAQVSDIDAQLLAFNNASFWGVDVTLNVQHGAVASKTLVIPYKITIYGRLL